jgi:uncharacterized damage-inducible protein DinB/GNAT superfamily N-acetyltransferase
MDLLKHIRLLAQYNEWMNARLYDTAARLAPDQLAQNRGAFFGSVLGTLNHIMVGDIVWLKRLGTHPAAHPSLEPVRRLEQPAALDQILHRDLGSLSDRRRQLDAVIRAWAGELSVADLDHVLEYRNMKGVPMRKLFGSLVLNLFSHQTHHRGQATTLLSQAGLDVGVTDLLALIPDEPAPIERGGSADDVATPPVEPARVRIRPATKADLPGVLELYAQPGLDEGAVLPIAEAQRIFDGFARYPDYVLYVAELDAEIIGTFALLVMDNLAHLGAPSAVVEDVAVDPAHRGRGIGQAMMAHALSVCRDKGCYKVALSSNLKRERAHAFYDSLGFERHGYSFRLDPRE